ncbi:MAG: FAD-dependent oxidoreductase, partial [Hyphomicrobium sp.]|nr:FAD-dependent oxidoreductase [Hyphomicrobium sp.]
AKVQHRRTLPTRVTQRLQVLAQNRVVQPVLNSTRPLQAPWAAGLFNKLPILQRIPALIVGVGVRPEHVHSPAAPAAGAR